MNTVSTTLNPLSTIMNSVDTTSSSDWIILDSTCVSKVDVGVQTMPTAIARLPVPSLTHPVPWGLGTDEASPLPTSKSIVKSVSESSTQYEGFIEVFPSNIGVQSVSTNTIHVPMRRASPQSVRHKDWTKAAKEFLSEEDRVDNDRLRTREERIKRVADDITDYYRRRHYTKESIKRKVLKIVDEVIIKTYGLEYLLSMKNKVRNRKCK